MLEHHPTRRDHPSDKDARQNKELERFPSCLTDSIRSENALGTIRRIVSAARCRRAVAAMEFAMVAPIMVICFFGTVDICRAFIAWAEVNNSAVAIAQAAEKLSVITANSLTKLTTTKMQAAMSTIYAQMPGLDYGNGDGFLGKGSFAVTLSGVVFTPTCYNTANCPAQAPITIWSSYLSEGGSSLNQTNTVLNPLLRACGPLTAQPNFPNNSTQLLVMATPTLITGGSANMTMVPQVVADVRFTFIPTFNMFVHAITFWASATLPSPLGGTQNPISSDTTGATGNAVNCPVQS